MPPTVFPLLRERKLALGIFVSGALLMLIFSEFLRWPCPFFHLTGIPCPGCGLTRATVLLLQGDLRGSLTFHAFAPLVLVGFGILGTAGLLPERSREPWLGMLERLERQSYLVFILLAALVFYWLGRVIFLNSAFLQLIRE